MDTKSLLPRELNIEILRKLPVKSLLRFKSVCTSWYLITKDPSFIKRYSSSSNPRNCNKILCFYKDPIIKAHSISLLNYETTEKVIDLEWPPFTEEGWPPFPRGEWPQLLDEGIENKITLSRDTSVLGPMNGVYCIYYRLIERLVGTLILWNPATREYKYILPPIRYPLPFQLLAVRWNPNQYIFDEKHPIGLDIGFGFVHAANDFKIVVISQWEHLYGPDNDGWHVKVYNVSTDSWRTIYYVTSYTDGQYCPFEEMYPRFPNIKSSPQFANGFLNGVFHWSCKWEWDIDGILAFDMENESFQLMKGPHSSTHYNQRSVWIPKDTLTTVLSSIDLRRNFSGTVEVWIMKEYGVEDSWIMLQSFGPFERLRCIGNPIDGQIFFCDDKGRLVSYDLENHIRKEYSIHSIYDTLEFGIHLNFGVLKYMESILSLKSIDYIQLSRSIGVTSKYEA